tara:strand:- start:614 stop:1075 length:462 start_codon:yes stop_codon:yes gene_type:complete
MSTMNKDIKSMIKDEMEKYRDEDRRQEAGTCIMGEMRKDREGEEQDNPELFKTEIDYHRYWKDMYEKEHKLRLEAEGETHLVKAVGMNSPEMKEAKAKLKETELGLANALQVNESHQKLNGKLQVRLTELEEENKKMHDYINKKIDAYRKSGM